MNIYLVDNSDTGHHELYQKHLNTINNTYIKNKLVDITSIRKNYIKGLIDRKNFLDSISSDIESNSLIHLLYIDSLYKCPFISNFIDNRKKIYIGTLHWIPDSKINVGLLKKFSKKLEYIIVHSEYLKEQLNMMGINNVISIDYPSFIKNSYDENHTINEKIIISCLGGTRIDKGVDILLDAFEYIEDTAKDKLIFNIAGIEQDIMYKDIISRAKKYNIDLITKNKFLTVEEYESEIIKSDIILLPYRKMFTGNSGPMTDGIYMNKFIIGPNSGNLGYLIQKYDLGVTFETENPKDLARKISNIIGYDLKKNHRYRENISLCKFIKKHENLYNRISERLDTSRNL